MTPDEIAAMLNGLSRDEVQTIAAYSIKAFKTYGRIYGADNTKAMHKIISNAIQRKCREQRTRERAA